MNNSIEAKKNNNFKWLFLIPIALIATCNVYLNTHQEHSIIEDPQPGDYFVFKNLIAQGDQPFKLKSIDSVSYEFYIPEYHFLNFVANKSEGAVYDLEAENKLYENKLVIRIPKSTVDSLIHNSDLSVRMQQSPNVYLKGVFGKHRPDAVTSTLDTLDYYLGMRSKPSR